MMMSEFIERVGFEPTAAEYAEIEQEYMGCNVDKDKFCKDWKKNGGIQRLCRMRARRIEELEAEVAMKDRQYDELDTMRCAQFNKMERDMQEKVDSGAKAIDKMLSKYEELEKQLKEESAKRIEAERKLAKIREAFAILGIAKEV